MSIIPENPYAALSELQRALHDRVVTVAGQAGVDPLLVLYGGLGGALLLADLAAIEQALTGQPVTVEQARARLTGPASVLDTLPVCGLPADQRVEVYSPRDGHAYGSLDASLYVCAEHHTPVRAAIDGAGLSAYTVPGTVPGPKRCGDGLDFTGDTPRVLTAPDPDSARWSPAEPDRTARYEQPRRAGERFVNPSGQYQELAIGEWHDAQGGAPC